MARSRISFGIFVPFLLVLVAAATWSIAWYYIADEAEIRIAAAIDDASGRGVTLDCDDRVIGGYPFRIEFRCTGAQLIVEDDKGQITVRSQSLLGVALAYDLNQIIVELQGPTLIDTFKLGGVRQKFAIATKTARASFEFDGTDISAVSILATGVAADIPPLGLLNMSQVSRVAADRAILHARRAGDAALDVAFTVDKFQLVGELAQSWFEAPELVAEQMDFLGQFTQVDFAPADAGENAVIAWQGRGGQLKIQRLKVETPALDFEISGIGKLNTSGEVIGNFTGIFGKLDRLIEELKRRGVLNDDSATLAAGAVGLLARPVKGSTKMQLPVSVTDGEVYIGPIKSMVLPPLF